MGTGRSYILNLNGRCNQSCLFCITSKTIEEGKALTYQNVRKQIIDAIKYGYQKIDFYGGEPTMYPFLTKAIGFASDCGLECTLATNAIKFASAQYAKTFFSNLTLKSVRISLHSHNERIHDKITQIPGSHQKTLTGVKHILRYLKTKKVCANIVITKLNYKDLPKIVRLAHSIGIPAVKFSGLCLTGRALDHRSLAVKLDLVGKHLAGAIRVAAQNDQLIFIEKLPLCIVKNFQLRKLQIVPEHNQNFVKPTLCFGCRLNNVCLGFDQRSLELFGIPKFYPMKVKNSATAHV